MNIYLFLGSFHKEQVSTTGVNTANQLRNSPTDTNTIQEKETLFTSPRQSVSLLYEKPLRTHKTTKQQEYQGGDLECQSSREAVSQDTLVLALSSHTYHSTGLGSQEMTSLTEKLLLFCFRSRQCQGDKKRNQSGKNVMVKPHWHEGVFIRHGKENALVIKNRVPGKSVYGEKRVSIAEGHDKIENRAWNPFRSQLATVILGSVDQIYIKPEAKVLYFGAATGTTVSHISDIVGQDSLVYAVEFSHHSGHDLINLAKKRTSIIPVTEDARHPHKYCMLIATVDMIFADTARPDQAQTVAANAHTFLRNKGHFVISIKANSTAYAEAVFASEVKTTLQEIMKRLESYERVRPGRGGTYRPPPKVKS
uniref:rRNA 2'-O-methyltransferase fibrillarin-like n=1 Tax=Jaculus jaculus TaxID=51337 RepID=UPI001E1B3676|nr:rRNA 2'-O-methyltransferase fibrillarin-like [Jaculus jaculus]